MLTANQADANCVIPLALLAQPLGQPIVSLVHPNSIKLQIIYVSKIAIMASMHQMEFAQFALHNVPHVYLLRLVLLVKLNISN